MRPMKKLRSDTCILLARRPLVVARTTSTTFFYSAGNKTGIRTQDRLEQLENGRRVPEVRTVPTLVLFTGNPSPIARVKHFVVIVPLQVCYTFIMNR